VETSLLFQECQAQAERYIEKRGCVQPYPDMNLVMHTVANMIRSLGGTEDDALSVARAFGRAEARDGNLQWKLGYDAGRQVFLDAIESLAKSQ
jgi:hypothetical protein